MPISGLRIANIIASGKSGLESPRYRRHGTAQCAGERRERSAFLIRDSKELELDGVSTREPLADAPVIRLDRCPGAILRGSRALQAPGHFSPWRRVS